jgi:dihydropyrimidinase
LIVKNGTIALSGEKNFILLNLIIEQGKISQISQNISGENVIDTVQMLIIPDGIDPHVLGFFGGVSGQYFEDGFQKNSNSWNSRIGHILYD